MCGVAGIFGNDDLNKNNLDNMLNYTNHRGPDHRGKFQNNKIQLGMNRLSIIDIENGNQPIFSEDKRYCIIFNGEIYNYLSLKNNLKSFYKFKTNSDTEVVLACFIKYRDKIFNYLNGIYAFAVWDSLEEKLYLARDPRGLKTLFYGKKSNTIFFASEPKAFYKSDLFKNINISSVYQLISSGYVFHPNSSIEGINQIYPGEMVMFNKDKEKKNYQSKTRIVFTDEKKNKEKHLSFVKNCISNTVNRQLISDVPVGLLLSSGLDSMSILSSLKEKNKLDQIETFTAFYPNSDESENRFVEKLSKEWNFKNHSFEINSENVYNELDNIFDTFDNFDFIPVCVSKYLITKFASKKLKVLLSGAGGDEIFLGYGTHIASNLRNNSLLSYKFFNILKKILIDEKYAGKHLSNYEKLKRFIEGSSYSNNFYPLLWRYVFNIDEIKSYFFSKNRKDKDQLINLIYGNQISYFNEIKLENKNFKNFLSNLDLNTWLIDHALLLWDKAGMANSVEVRSPLLDIEFLNQINELNPDQRASKIGNKSIIKKIFSNDLPDYIINMPKKGFSVPVDKWIEYPLTNKLFKDLTFSLPDEFINKNYLEKIWNNFSNKKGNYTYKIWILSCLAGWLEKNNLKFEL